MSPEEVDDLFEHLDELSKEHTGLSDKAFVDEVFMRYAQMPSKQALTNEPQSLAVTLSNPEEDAETDNLLGKLGAVD